MVTLLRAFGNAGISHVPDFRDPTARRLLPPAWSRRFLRAEARLRRAPSTLLDVTRHGADRMVLRTLVIDEHVREAVRGVRVNCVAALRAARRGTRRRRPSLIVAGFTTTPRRRRWMRPFG
jgi:hypothetical protein